MLQSADGLEIYALAKASGRSVYKVDMQRFQEGSILQATSQSGNILLLEVIKQGDDLLHFARYSPKGSAIYLGQQTLLSQIIEVGKTLTYNSKTTQIIKKILILVE